MSWEEKAMPLKAIVLPIICVLIITVLGCAKYYVQTTPSVKPIEADAVLDLRTSEPVSINNAQGPKESLVFNAGGYGKYFAQSTQWTDTAVDNLVMRFKQRGAAVNKNAKKTLTLSISEIQFSYWDSIITV